MFFNAIILALASAAAVSGKKVDDAASGFLVTSYFSGGSCSDTKTTYKTVGEPFGVCLSTTFEAPEYALALKYTDYMSASCADDSVISTYAVKSECADGVHY